MIDNKIFEKRRRIVIECINNIKKRRPIVNQRLDSFSWWIAVERTIQHELFEMLERLNIR